MMKSYTFHVSIPGTGRTWRKIEMHPSQTLEELHLAIQFAFNFSNDHLYSFFMSGRAWDKRTEYTDITLQPANDPAFTALMGNLEDILFGINIDDLLPMPKSNKKSRPKKVNRAKQKQITAPEYIEDCPPEEAALPYLETLNPPKHPYLPEDLLEADERMRESFESKALYNWYSRIYEPGDTTRVMLEELDLKPKQEFLYLFDYGDEWRFKIRVHAVNEQAEPGQFPRIVESVGTPPPQYAVHEYADWEQDEDDEGFDDDLDEGFSGFFFFKPGS